MASIVYLDQNAWVTLAKGSWDKKRYPDEHKALTQIVSCINSGSMKIPLTFTNIYETSKINVPYRRANMALTQSLISGGVVFRSRRRILAETLGIYFAEKFSIPAADQPTDWFLSDVWFEAAADYSLERYGFEVSERAIHTIQKDPSHALYEYLLFKNEELRLESVRRYSAQSSDLVALIESRRALVAGETLALRKRAYGARLIVDDIEVILAVAQGLGLGWSTVGDIGSSLVRSIAVDVPIFNVERELAVRLEDQRRAITENDLRDMMSFVVAVPFADIVVAEKQFVNLSRQANFDDLYKTKLLTTVFDLL